MELASPQEKSTAYLILRHVYDGDVIEWPIADDHPLRHIFLALEGQGYLARWDRVWPLHDRYRLTDKGIAAIEAVYKPAEAEQVFREVRGQSFSPKQRRAYLVQRGYDPYLWPVLHDPATYWDVDVVDGRIHYHRGYSSYHDWFWEDEQGYRYRHDNDTRVWADDPPDPVADVPDLQVPDTDDPRAVYAVDLDREAGEAGDGSTGPAALDYDVS